MTSPNCKTRRCGQSFVRRWVAKSSISGQISFSSTLGKGLNLLQGRLSCLWRSAHVALQSLSLCTKQPKGRTRPEQWLRKTQTLQLGWLPKNHCMRIPFTQTNLVQNLTLDLIASISGCVEEKWRELCRQKSHTPAGYVGLLLLSQSHSIQSMDLVRTSSGEWPKDTETN